MSHGPIYLFNVFNIFGRCTVCQTFPSDAAERDLFQVSFSVGDMDWKTRDLVRFPTRSGAPVVVLAA
jgi:hypothetical protein